MRSALIDTLIGQVSWQRPTEPLARRVRELAATDRSARHAFVMLRAVPYSLALCEADTEPVVRQDPTTAA
jgi:hypothetical protein